MELQSFNLNIEGYWRYKNRAGIPNHSGIFFVYETKYNNETDTVSLLRIIYVGEAENVNERIAKHELDNEWRNNVMEENELSFSTGYIEVAYRTRVKAAFIFKLKPVINSYYKDEFPFEQTTIISTGKTKLLDTDFTLQRT